MDAVSLRPLGLCRKLCLRLAAGQFMEPLVHLRRGVQHALALPPVEPDPGDVAPGGPTAITPPTTTTTNSGTPSATPVQPVKPMQPAGRGSDVEARPTPVVTPTNSGSPNNTPANTGTVNTGNAASGNAG